MGISCRATDRKEIRARPSDLSSGLGCRVIKKKESIVTATRWKLIYDCQRPLLRPPHDFPRFVSFYLGTFVGQRTLEPAEQVLWRIMRLLIFAETQQGERCTGNSWQVRLFFEIHASFLVGVNSLYSYWSRCRKIKHAEVKGKRLFSLTSDLSFDINGWCAFMKEFKCAIEAVDRSKLLVEPSKLWLSRLSGGGGESSSSSSCASSKSKSDSFSSWYWNHQGTRELENSI